MQLRLIRILRLGRRCSRASRPSLKILRSNGCLTNRGAVRREWVVAEWSQYRTLQRLPLEPLRDPCGCNRCQRGHGSRCACGGSRFRDGPVNADLVPNINQGLAVSFVPGEVVQPQCTAPCFNHGTHVGESLQQRSTMLGAGRRAPSRTRPGEGSAESGSGSFSWIIAGMEYAASIHADVINMSLVRLSMLPMREKITRPRDVTLRSEPRCQSCHCSGVLVVSSAGNNGLNLTAVS